MKLFIFEPAANWDYCGGVVMALAKTQREAITLIHNQFAKEKLLAELQLSGVFRLMKLSWKAAQQKTFQELVAIVKSKEKEIDIDKPDTFKSLVNSLSVETSHFEKCGKSNKNVCGHYWDLFICAETKLTHFPDGSQVYQNWNFA